MTGPVWRAVQQPPNDTSPWAVLKPNALPLSGYADTAALTLVIRNEYPAWVVDDQQPVVIRDSAGQ